MTKELMTMGGAKGQELLTALVKQEPGWLDRPIEDIAKMVDLGSVWLQTQRAILKKIANSDVPAIRDYWKSRLEVARTGSWGYFEGMRKVGQARKDVKKAVGGDQIHGKRIPTADGIASKKDFDDRIGFAESTSQRAELVDTKWEMVKLAFKNAKGTDDFPSMNDFLDLAGRFRQSGKRKRQLTVQQTADAIHTELLEINVLMDSIVEHLDQVQKKTFEDIIEATRSLVEILTKKAPAEYKALARRLE